MQITSRYTGAWAEICSRIQARQQVNLLFAGSLMSLFVATFTNGYEKSKDVLYIVPLVSALITWAYCLWIASHENIIGLLSKYIVSIEHYEYKQNKSDSQSLLVNEIPSFHDPAQTYSGKSLKARCLTDFATAICIVISAIPSGYIGIINVQINAQKFLTIYAFSCCAICLFGSFFVFKNRLLRKRLLE